MSRRKCCCRDCEVFTDSFNRANSTNIGTDWIEHSGDWEIDTFELKSNDVGMVRTTVGINNTQRRYASVKCINPQEGKAYRLAVCVPADNLSYTYIELDCGAEPAATLALGVANYIGGNWTSAGAVDEADATYTAGEDLTLVACCSTGGIYGYVETQSNLVWDCIGCGGKYAGVAGGIPVIEYDDFEFYRHAIDILPITDGRCIECACECEGYCIPKTLTLTLQSTCSNRNGFEITLTIDESAYPAFQWIGTGDLTNPADDPPQTTNVDALFTCNHADCSDPPFSLCLDGFGGGCSTETWASGSGVTCIGSYASGGECVSAYTCSPLNLQFGPSLCSVSDWGECTETWIVTE